MGDKKIALCLSGRATHSLFCFPYIYDNLINGYDVDVYIHTWDKCRVINMYNPQNTQIENQELILDQILPQVNLNNLRIEGNINNNISMFYSIKKCFDLLKGKYDYIIRSRFDLVLQPEFNLQPIFDKLDKGYDMFIPNTDFNMGGYNDQFSISTPESALIYSNTFLNINQITQNLGRWHPESILGYQLDTNNVKIFQHDIDYRIVRNVNIQTHWPENPYNFISR